MCCGDQPHFRQTSARQRIPPATRLSKSRCGRPRKPQKEEGAIRAQQTRRQAFLMELDRQVHGEEGSSQACGAESSGVTEFCWFARSAAFAFLIQFPVAEPLLRAGRLQSSIIRKILPGNVGGTKRPFLLTSRHDRIGQVIDVWASSRRCINECDSLAVHHS